MKIKTYFLNSNKLFSNKQNLTILFMRLFLNTSVFSQLPAAQQVASHMKVGWNLGNTLEVICGETT
jgi:endoglucanase